MLKRYLSLTLAVLVVNLSFSVVALAQGTSDKSAKAVEKMKGQIARLGTGESAKISIELRDGSKVRGYVRESTDSGVVVADASGTVTEVPYKEAKKVKGLNAGTGVKIAIIVGIVIGALALIGWGLSHTDEW